MRRFAALLVAGVVALLAGCNLIGTMDTRSPVSYDRTATQNPSSVPAVATAVPTQVQVPENGSPWQMILPGLTQQTLVPPGNLLAQMHALRIDPEQYRFRVHYRPGEPLYLDAWRDLLPEAVVIVNANFFRSDHRIEGLLVSDGVSHGRTYTDRGGTFAVQNGVVRVFSNLVEPYSGQIYEQAVQAFPMLVLDGDQAYQRSRDRRPSRRTVIGQDREGQVILLATPLLGMGLYDLSRYLSQADLNLIAAFNLDGGGSTMLHVTDSSAGVQSFDPVPAVLAVYPR